MSVEDARLDHYGDACRIWSGGLSRRPDNGAAEQLFRGIASDSSPTEQLRVLFIHGIGISDAHSADALLLHLKDALGFKQPVPEPEPQMIYVEGVPIEDNAVLYNFQFVAEPGHGPMKFSFSAVVATDNAPQDQVRPLGYRARRRIRGLPW